MALSVIAIQAGWPLLVLQDCTSVSLLSQVIRSLHACLVFAVHFSPDHLCFCSFFFFSSFPGSESVSFPLLLTGVNCQQFFGAFYGVTGEILQLASRFRSFYKCMYPQSIRFGKLLGWCTHPCIGIETKIVKSLDTREGRLSQNMC